MVEPVKGRLLGNCGMASDPMPCCAEAAWLGDRLKVEHATLRRYVLFSATSLLMAVALAFLLGTNTCDMEIGSLLRSKLVRDRVVLTPSVSGAVIAIGTSLHIDQSDGEQRVLRETYLPTAMRIIRESEKGSEALHSRLKDFCYTIGPRLSGTPQLDTAIQWFAAELEGAGLEEVRLQAVPGVSHWVRGAESWVMTEPRPMAISMIGLGGSVGGSAAAEVLVVDSFADLESKKDSAAGKIVLFNAKFVTYGETVMYRITGATAAAKVGAVGCLVRSISSFSMGNPHTGAMEYDAATPKIMAAAISTEHADLLAWLSANSTVRVTLIMSGYNADPALSHNVMGQITGSEKPNEVITIGGHIDSWDIGMGAMDDAGGLFCCLEALRVMKALGLRPKRTIRVVGFTNEEEGNTNGVLGGDIYAKEHSHETHVLAIESDSGVFSPEGFFFHGSDASLQIITSIARTCLAPLGATEIRNGTFAGTDVEPIANLYGTTALELLTHEEKYFWYHHSAADTPDKLDPKEMGRGAAAIAIVSFVIADMEVALPSRRVDAVQKV